jgi:hypothetical protein
MNKWSVVFYMFYMLFFLVLHRFHSAKWKDGYFNVLFFVLNMETVMILGQVKLSPFSHIEVSWNRR